jgi:hypothetical protein
MLSRFLAAGIVVLAASAAWAAPARVNESIPVASSDGKFHGRFPQGNAPNSDPTVGVLQTANDVFANWTNAGLAKVGGIPTRTTQCGSVVAQTQIIPPASGDDAATINAAIAACPAGQVVQLACGATQAITASIVGNTLTVTAGSGLAVGMELFDTTGVLMPGTTITANVDSTHWTVSYSAYNGTSLAVPSEAMTAVVVFNVAQASEFIHVNNGITLRGCGSYSSGKFWPSVINSYSGPIPNWTISPTTGAANCGVTSTTAASCSIGNPVILISPNSNSGDFGWSGHSQGSATSSVGSGTTLASDVAQGAMTIQVASTANFVVGGWFLIAENPALVTTTNPITGFSNASIQASPDFLSSSASPATDRVASPDPSSAGTAGAFSLWPNIVNNELHLVTAIGAGPCPGTNCTLTFDDPLTIAFRQSGGHNTQVFWPTNCCSSTPTQFLTNAGIENLEITRGFTSVEVEFCAQCWVRNIEAAGFIAGAVTFRMSSRSELTGSYLHLSFDGENNGTEYPLSMDYGSIEILADNNIMQLGGKCMVGRASASNVVAYNYCGPTTYEQQSIGSFFQDQSINGSHYAGTHHFLFEGNMGNNCDSDETHGNAVYHTFFRNDCTGLRPPFTEPSNTSLTTNDATGISFCGGGSCGAGVQTAPGPLYAAGPMAFDYWFAFVGNVLGTSSQTTSGNGWTYQCNIGGSANTHSGNKCLWMTGRTGSEWNGAGDPNLNLVAGSGAFVFRNGNFDYVNAAVVDNASGFSQAFPNSFYASSKPAFFSSGTCTYPWPWVTPAAGAPIQTNSCGGSALPAKARFDAGTWFGQP